MIKDIPDYEGIYAVDDKGNVYSYRFNKIKMLKTYDNGRGYDTVKLIKDGDRKTFSVHRLVAKTFLPDFEERLEVDHIDRNRKNSSVSNLRMVTHQENQFNQNGRGFTWHKQAKKFRAQISINGKSKYLGLFDTDSEAIEAYLNAKEKYHIIK